ncbi:hypothetical protein LR48_Vigan08g034500 [Vigna angularis]|uniref:Gamma-glutamyltranspeptidase n=1 Tax=Phaseolus angularis TaxID=3914 RepID=A0A0L9V3B3_PHAAN|nr:hypothetical protein LR48_Vigan08g034500 [Vigna angularis]
MRISYNVKLEQRENKESPKTYMEKNKVAPLAILLCELQDSQAALRKYNEGLTTSDEDIVESDVGVVATDDARCSAIGVSLIKQGGHAVDAAVAAALCIGVVLSASSGIGGGGFMVVRSSSTSQTQAFDMRETAPASASQGFEVSPTLGGFIAEDAKKILDDPGLRKLYAPEGTLLKEGDVCKNEELGRTLEVVAEQGPQAFYNGTIAEKLVKDIKEAGGILTMEDLRNYKVEIADAMTLNVMGYTIYGMPPPSSGTLALSLVCTFLSPLFCHVAL